MNFNPRAPCGARPMLISPPIPLREISTHAPLAGRDQQRGNRCYFSTVFQPTRPLRGATGRIYAALLRQHFNPRAPCGARPMRLRGANGIMYFNPRAPCGARLRGDDAARAAFYISTHAPLAGRDPARRGGGGEPDGISTHAPLAGRDTIFAVHGILCTIFQPTRPLRGATKSPALNTGAETFQPTRPLRGATFFQVVAAKGGIFQPTRPLRGATC